ncbi:Fc.00g024600.m01.CDS01 [Cosmosporella sp. VM-42]
MSPALETLVLDHVPASYSVHLAFFRNVQNASFLHQQLLARNGDFEYAFIDASVVLSRLQLLSAIFKATLASAHDTLKTPNVHSEVVMSLSSSNNIADSYRRFGISPSTQNLLVVKITFPTEANPTPTSSTQIWDHLTTHVDGEATQVTDVSISAATDLPKVRKYYKLNGLRWLDDIKDDVARRKEMEMLVLGGMALRGV